jgi:hypothetical protein
LQHDPASKMQAPAVDDDASAGRPTLVAVCAKRAPGEPLPELHVRRSRRVIVRDLIRKATFVDNREFFGSRRRAPDTSICSTMRRGCAHRLGERINTSP